MAVNKVEYGGNTLIDLTADTLSSPDQLAQGIIAHDRTGAVITGTATGGGSGGAVYQDEDGFLVLDDDASNAFSDAVETLPNGGLHHIITGIESSGGGGGLEYEEGIWTPSEDVAIYLIQFNNTHTTAPFYYAISDTTGTYYATENTNFGIRYLNWEQVLGSGIAPSSIQTHYGRLDVIYRGTNNANFNTTSSVITFPSSSTEDNSTVYPRYWASETRIRADSNSTTRYWRAGRTYKWIAVWAPTA